MARAPKGRSKQKNIEHERAWWSEIVPLAQAIGDADAIVAVVFAGGWAVAMWQGADPFMSAVAPVGGYGLYTALCRFRMSHKERMAGKKIDAEYIEQERTITDSAPKNKRDLPPQRSDNE